MIRSLASVKTGASPSEKMTDADDDHGEAASLSICVSSAKPTAASARPAAIT